MYIMLHSVSHLQRGGGGKQHCMIAQHALDMKRCITVRKIGAEYIIRISFFSYQRFYLGKQFHILLPYLTIARTRHEKQACNNI